VARVVRRIAFDFAAGAYELVTDEPPWRRDCRDMAALVPGRRVLDLGVGPGISAIEMARAAPATLFVGLDVSGSMLRRASRHAAREPLRLPLVRGDLARLPFADASFDGVTGHSLLYLLGDAEAALAEVRRVVRSGGHAAFLEPRAERGALRGALAAGVRFGTAMALWRVMSRLHRRWSEGELVALLERAGFEAVRAWPVLHGFGVVAAAVRGVDAGAGRP
jgi:ubiquinone/menaquinone biosynthesis C-methylase UbiE